MILHVFDIGGSVESHYFLFLVFVVQFGSRCECKVFFVFFMTSLHCLIFVYLIHYEKTYHTVRAVPKA
jgi:hypothetical protein